MSSERHTYFLLRPPLDPSAAGEFLGRFCTNPKDPTIHYRPQDLNRLHKVLSRLKSPPLETNLKFERDGRDLSAPSLQAYLATIFRLGASRERSLSIKLSSPKATIRKAQQLDDYLDALLEDPEIKEELLGILKSNRGVSYMAVATLTLVDAKLSVVGNGKRELVGELDSKGVLGMAGVPAPSARIAGTYHRSQELNEKQTIEGRKIFGVEYYKVTKGSFWEKADTVSLAKKPTSAGRLGVYGDNEEDAEEDPMDADISDISFERVGGQIHDDDIALSLEI